MANCICNLKGIERCAVVGVSKGANENDIPVIVAHNPNGSLSKIEILNHLKANLPERSEMIKDVFFIERYPITATGKVQTFLIKEFASNQMKLSAH